MVPFMQCKLINDREERMKEEKGEQVEAGEMKERRGEAKQGSCSALKEVTYVLNRKPALASLGCTHAHAHTHTHTQCYLRDLTQVQMLHSDLLDSPSHVNIQEWREKERGKDGWGTISREGRTEKRYFHGNGEGARER